MPDAEPFQPHRRVIEAMVLEMEPLADAEPRRVIGEMPRRPLRRAVLAQQPHVEMPVIGRALRLLVAGGRPAGRAPGGGRAGGEPAGGGRERQWWAVSSRKKPPLLGA